MSPASVQLFPPIAQQHVFTDHSVATILAPERQPLLPSGDERRHHDVSLRDMTESLYSAFTCSSSLRFTDSGNDSITRGVADTHHQIGSSFSPYVDPMTFPCRSGRVLINHFNQPRQEDRTSSGSQPVVGSTDFQTDGFGTSASKDGVEGDDVDQWTTTQRGDVSRPTPTFPRPSPSLPTSASTDSPHLQLESEDLWRRFDELTTEMVITKTGRSVSSDS